MRPEKAAIPTSISPKIQKENITPNAHPERKNNVDTSTGLPSD
jgi:hypothetical protein